MNIRFKEMTEKDVENLIPIMKAAFNYDTKIHFGKEAGVLQDMMMAHF